MMFKIIITTSICTLICQLNQFTAIFRGFINVVSWRATGLHRQAKLFEQNFFATKCSDVKHPRMLYRGTHNRADPKPRIVRFYVYKYVSSSCSINYIFAIGLTWQLAQLRNHLPWWIAMAWFIQAVTLKELMVWLMLGVNYMPRYVSIFFEVV